MKAPAEEAFASLVASVGPLTPYVEGKLQYPAGTDISKFFYAEQIDAIALAIRNVESKDGALILADQTGFGKGRVAAAMIRYAAKQGKVPIFFTGDKNKLYKAMVDDLIDINSAEITPVFTDSEISFTDQEGRKFNQRKGATFDMLDAIGHSKALPSGSDVLLHHLRPAPERQASRVQGGRGGQETPKGFEEATAGRAKDESPQGAGP